MSAIDEKKNKPPDKKTDYFKCVKIPLKHVLKNPDINLPKITDAVIKCNKIVINTLMFMKLYLLDYFDKNNKLPEIDKIFVNSCMKILCNENASGRPPKKEIKELKDKLTAFYNSDYKPLIKDTDLDYTYLNTVLDYLTIGIITMYENNIKLHYVEYIERYVNIIWKKKDTINKIKEDNKNNNDDKQKELIKKYGEDDGNGGILVRMFDEVKDDEGNVISRNFNENYNKFDEEYGTLLNQDKEIEYPEITKEDLKSAGKTKDKYQVLFKLVKK